MPPYQANLRRRAAYLAQIGLIAPERMILLGESGVTTSLANLRARCEGGGRIAGAMAITGAQLL